MHTVSTTQSGGPDASSQQDQRFPEGRWRIGGTLVLVLVLGLVLCGLVLPPHWCLCRYWWRFWLSCFLFLPKGQNQNFTNKPKRIVKLSPAGSLSGCWCGADGRHVHTLPCSWAPLHHHSGTLQMSRYVSPLVLSPLLVWDFGRVVTFRDTFEEAPTNVRRHKLASSWLGAELKDLS